MKMTGYIRTFTHIYYTNEIRYRIFRTIFGDLQFFIIMAMWKRATASSAEFLVRHQ